ncbi:hypothetical protein, secreted [gut metagenome]|uniref:Dipeptidyl-peptidase n=1 Tax=gut metagenome TaxID=749906 RepID=J9FQE7_9ZZZZ
MKKVLLLCMALVMSLGGARADEGMWLLKLMEEQHLADSLRKAGLQLPPEALYNESAPSLRECVGIFGGGCTGEIVSPDGLVLTNHHCGFSYVHAMSGIGHDYMKDGYFAKSRAEELRTPDDLTFTFVLRVQEVTKEVGEAAKKAKADEYTAQSQGFLRPLADKLLKKSDLKKKKGVKVRIVPFFGGNRFYMFYEQEFLDVRLVANPPHNIGQFGGNSDNWMWPRQNADFAMFRIYADKNGDPAAYSKDNVPLKVKKFLPISLKGLNEGDYTMIMGFPGRTSRYLTAAQVKMRCESQNAPFVIAGNPLLKYYKELMDQSDELRLLLEDEYFSWGNMVKNFGGMNEAVEKIDLVGQKQAEEARFRAFAKQSGKKEYADVIDRIAKVCETYGDTLHDAGLFTITLALQNFQAPAGLVDDWAKAVKAGKEKDITAAKQALLVAVNFASPRDFAIDRGKLELLAPYFVKYKKLAAAPAYLEGKDVKAVVDYMHEVYTKSIFADSARLVKAVESKDVAALQGDLLYKLTDANYNYSMKLNTSLQKYGQQMAELNKIYVGGLCEMYDWSKAPDANFTLRMTYGHICDLKPRDAVRYDWKTMLDGMFEKESKTESDYFINERLRKLYEAKDFGRYARKDGKLPTCFLSNNDITGGNSGSPIMNAKGEMIGLAFDGNIESLSSDLKFNPALQRCINVDIRFVLFIIDKFGGASYVLDEMDIRE